MRTLALLIALAAICCGGGEDDDCDIAHDELNVQKDAKLGEDCAVYHYGTCTEDIGTCAEGECLQTVTAGKICTKNCDEDSDCADIGICHDSVCQPNADCDTFCDGTLCCSYKRDPDDPTQCIQTHC